MDWKNKFSSIDNKIRSQLFARKTENFMWLNRCADEFDQKNTGKMSIPNLNLFLNKAGIFLSTQELRTIRDHFDYDKDGQISYIDLIKTIKDNLSERVMRAIKQAFDFLDQQGEGYVSFDHLFSLYKAGDHPHTQTRSKFGSQVSNEFREGIFLKSADQKGITQKEFFDYYSELGVCIPAERQSYFVNMILSTWGLKQGKYFVEEKRLQELEITLYQKIRQRQSNELNTAKTAFKYFDLSDSGSCDLQNFSRALDKFGCKFADHEVFALFQKYDTSHDGLLSYNEFCQMLVSIEKPQKINPLTTLGQNSIGFKQLRM